MEYFALTHANLDSFNQFINKHINDDVNKLRLKKFHDYDFDVKFAILQIECLNRIKKKLPSIFEGRSFIFPSVLSTEQCTAQPVALFHASLFSSDETVLDLTAGLCIDSYYIAQRVKSLIALELTAETAKVAQFNMQRLTNNVSVLNCDSTDFINNLSEKYSTIFVDPDRRGCNNKRLYGIADCSPNILPLLAKIKSCSDRLIIKASPMIDISQSIKELQPFNVTEIYIISVKNECKELLFVLDFKREKNYTLFHAINFINDIDTEQLDYCFDTDDDNSQTYSLPVVGEYLYEPNSSIMKGALFKAVAQNFKGNKLNINTHLYCSSNYYGNFPGRKFKICDILQFKDSQIKQFNKKYPQINVSTRNFKLGADALKKKLKVKDGGDKYLFGVTDSESKALLLICEKAR